MPKRSSYDIKRKILLAVKEKSLTYAQLERKVNTGFRTIKANCEELEDFGTVKIDKLEKHPANARVFYKISITKQGMEYLDKD